MSLGPRTMELLEAVRRTLAEDVAPTLSGDARYQVLLAANAIATAGRELTVDDQRLAAEADRLSALLGVDGGDRSPASVESLAGRLAEAIRAGDFDHPARHGELIGALRATTARTLEATNPKVAARCRRSRHAIRPDPAT